MHYPIARCPIDSGAQRLDPGGSSTMSERISAVLDLLRNGPPHPVTPAIALREAMVCEDCSCVVPVAASCSTCGSHSVWPLQMKLDPMSARVAQRMRVAC
jgi:hypothetical protein